jgi:1-acyl-sn-glycerol-3-phosphate acyltransferase
MLIQLRSEPEHRARIIAANNILNALFMVVGALAAAGLLGAGLSIPALFGVAALCNAAVAIYIYSWCPSSCCASSPGCCHRRSIGCARGTREHPARGPAVLVCNHVSFVDPLVIMAASRRPIRFVMDHRIFRTPLISFVFRHMQAIPIAPAKEDAAMMEAAFEEVARRSLDAGELVAIFPEGRITDTGELYPFRPGVQRIVGRTPVPVIPMALQGSVGQLLQPAAACFRRSRSRLDSRWRPLRPRPSICRRLSRVCGARSGERHDDRRSGRHVEPAADGLE